MNEGQGIGGEVFPIPGEPAAAPQPGDRSFNDPAFGENHEALGLIGPSDDLDIELRQDLGERVVKDRSCIGTVGKQLFQEGEHAEERGQQQNATVTILNIGRMNDGVQQQPHRIDQNVSLLSLDQLAAVKPVRIDARPPFSALFTLWLSIIAALGLACRSTASRHFTYSA